MIIIGGGFGGVTLAQHLERKLSSGVEITLISSENHFVFTPMLAEVVGRTLSPPAHRRRGPPDGTANDVADGAGHGHRLTRQPGQLCRRRASERSLTYDHLVLACGSVVNMNLMPGLAAYAYPLKTLGDAIYLGNDLIARLEEPRWKLDPARRRRLTHYRGHWRRIQRRRGGRRDRRNGERGAPLLPYTPRRATAHHPVATR